MKKRIPVLLMLGVGLLVWRTGLFGFLPTDRTLVWRLPASYAEVRKLELQVWDGEELLKREELSFPAGLSADPSFRLSLKAGAHRAIANAWLKSAAEPRAYHLDFDPGGEETVFLELRKP